ncbi:FERM domain-containing 7-like protein, partial [Clarias magur]
PDFLLYSVMDTMNKADDLCGELFSRLDQQEKCAEHLQHLAAELEEITESKRKRQLKYNIVNVSVSSGLVIAGISGLFLAGLPLLSVLLLGVSTAGMNSMKPLSDKVVKEWKSSKVMKNAMTSAKEIEQIQNNTKKHLKKLSEECEVQGLKASSSEEVQCEITARILKAVAKRRGKDLPLSYLRHVLRNNDLASQIDLNPTIFQHISFLLTVLGCSFSHLKTMTQTSQNMDGFLGRMLTVSDWIDNCEKLIKNNNQQEASNFLRTKATDMCESMRKLKMHLNAI